MSAVWYAFAGEGVDTLTFFPVPRHLQFPNIDYAPHIRCAVFIVSLIKIGKRLFDW